MINMKCCTPPLILKPALAGLSLNKPKDGAENIGFEVVVILHKGTLDFSIFQAQLFEAELLSHPPQPHRIDKLDNRGRDLTKSIAKGGGKICQPRFIGDVVKRSVQLETLAGARYERLRN